MIFVFRATFCGGSGAKWPGNEHGVVEYGYATCMLKNPNDAKKEGEKKPLLLLKLIEKIWLKALIGKFFLHPQVYLRWN